MYLSYIYKKINEYRKKKFACIVFMEKNIGFVYIEGAKKLKNCVYLCRESFVGINEIERGVNKRRMTSGRMSF